MSVPQLTEYQLPQPPLYEDIIVNVSPVLPLIPEPPSYKDTVNDYRDKKIVKKTEAGCDDALSITSEHDARNVVYVREVQDEEIWKTKITNLTKKYDAMSIIIFTLSLLIGLFFCILYMINSKTVLSTIVSYKITTIVDGDLIKNTYIYEFNIILENSFEHTVSYDYSSTNYTKLQKNNVFNKTKKEYVIGSEFTYYTFKDEYIPNNTSYIGVFLLCIQTILISTLTHQYKKYHLNNQQTYEIIINYYNNINSNSDTFDLDIIQFTSCVVCPVSTMNFQSYFPAEYRHLLNENNEIKTIMNKQIYRNLFIHYMKKKWFCFIVDRFVCHAIIVTFIPTLVYCIS